MGNLPSTNSVIYSEIKTKMDIIIGNKIIKISIFGDIKIPNCIESLGKWKVWVGLVLTAINLILFLEVMSYLRI